MSLTAGVADYPFRDSIRENSPTPQVFEHLNLLGYWYWVFEIFNCRRQIQSSSADLKITGPEKRLEVILQGKR